MNDKDFRGQPPISSFLRHHFRHFNAATLIDAADGYRRVLDDGGRMFVTLAGAMSTGELGLTLSEMIRQDKVQAICCTGANLEEDVFNLVAHDHYERLPRYRDLTRSQEVELLNRKLNRVTDTCIPEEEAMRKIDKLVMNEWKTAQSKGEKALPHEYIYRIIDKWESLPEKERPYQIDAKDSWIVAAFHKKLPLFVPGWEDSTLGNSYVSEVFKGVLDRGAVVLGGLDYMIEMVEWYREATSQGPVGFFQIGGGIAGDFPICVVPLINQDIRAEEVPLWSYFCQISDSTTSYGSYSGAVPNEKITWGKLGKDTPSYLIESDATIVVPLIFAQILGW